MATIQDIQIDCLNNSLHCLGTSYIFSQKAKTYKTRIRIITILGVVVPILIGATATTYGQSSTILTIAIAITAPLAILQAVLSGISLVNKWDDTLAYSLESQTDNQVIFNEYQNLAKNPKSTIEQMQHSFDVIKAKDQARTAQDIKISFSNKEERKGMRYALWILQRQCATCKQVPASMTPSKCDTCGNF